MAVYWFTLYIICMCDVRVSVFRDLTAICDTAACLDVKIMVVLWKTISRLLLSFYTFCDIIFMQFMALSLLLCLQEGCRVFDEHVCFVYVSLLAYLKNYMARFTVFFVHVDFAHGLVLL